MKDEQLELEYNEYLEELEEGVRPISWYDFKARRTTSFDHYIKKSEVVEKKLTKSMIARQIFDVGKLEGLSRKEIMELFVLEAGLTKAGAATYYSNFMNSLKPVITTINITIPEIKEEVVDNQITEVA